MGLQSLIEYSNPGAKRLLLGIVGQGPSLDALTRILARDDFIAAFPWVKVAGWVPSPGVQPDNSSLEIPAILQSHPLFPDVPSLFAARPGISLALDVSHDSRHMEELRKYAPLSASLATSENILRFCEASEDGTLSIGGADNLRKAQKLFALLVDQLDGDILIIDRHDIILDMNRHVCESRGLTRAQIVGTPCAELPASLKPVLTDKAVSSYPEAKHTGKKAEITTAEVMDSGRVRYIHSICIPIADTYGKPLQFLYIRRDVTEQQHMEQRLQQTEKMAAIGELSMYMAHEIRNPVFSIGGFANSLLRNPSLDDMAREKARVIYEESRRLDGILANMLNFARPMEQTLSIFDPDDTARQAIGLINADNDERGIATVVDIPPHLPHVKGNPETLRQCLINLIKNSAEAMPDGGTITLRARLNSGFVQMDVEDTGIGIPPELQGQVFSPFYTTKEQGAGLGLAMTRKMIEEIGGKVTLASHVGKGTRVSLMLPVALTVEEDTTIPDA
ncbi:MAG: PAS domain S-box protein [Desulfovibrio sp.]|jgi:PAS domain S-box-containing protein|nr:PAS domain S-box protein [Desulfovibrio sp.]